MKRNNKQFIINNWKFFAIFIMLGFIMYWTAIVVQPTITILEQQNQAMEEEARQTNGTIQVVKWILGNLTVLVNQTK